MQYGRFFEKIEYAGGIKYTNEFLAERVSLLRIDYRMPWFEQHIFALCSIMYTYGLLVRPQTLQYRAPPHVTTHGHHTSSPSSSSSSPPSPLSSSWNHQYTNEFLAESVSLMPIDYRMSWSSKHIDLPHAASFVLTSSWFGNVI